LHKFSNMTGLFHEARSRGFNQALVSTTSLLINQESWKNGKVFSRNGSHRTCDIVFTKVISSEKQSRKAKYIALILHSRKSHVAIHWVHKSNS